MLSELRSKWQDVLVKKIENEMAIYRKQINKLTSNKAQFNSKSLSLVMIISYHNYLGLFQDVILLRNIPKHLPFLSLLKPDDWATIVLDQVSECMYKCVVCTHSEHTHTQTQTHTHTQHTHTNTQHTNTHTIHTTHTHKHNTQHTHTMYT